MRYIRTRLPTKKRFCESMATDEGSMHGANAWSIGYATMHMNGMPGLGPCISTVACKWNANDGTIL